MLDTQLCPTFCSAEELSHLRYFGITGVIFTPFIPPQIEIQTTQSFVRYLNKTISTECARLRQASICGRATIALNLTCRPYRAHYDIWENLEQLARETPVIGIGSLRVSELTAQTFYFLERHIELANALEIPLVLEMPTTLNVTTTVEMVDRLLLHAPKNVIFQRLDPTMLDYVLEAGFSVVLTTNKLDHEVSDHEIDELITRIDEIQTAQPSYLDQMMLASMYGEVRTNLLGVPRLIDRLEKSGEFTEEVIENLAWRNGKRLFNLSGRNHHIEPEPSPECSKFEEE